MVTNLGHTVHWLPSWDKKSPRSRLQRVFTLRRTCCTVLIPGDPRYLPWGYNIFLHWPVL